jgi:hypothetical protein
LAAAISPIRFSGAVVSVLSVRERGVEVGRLDDKGRIHITPGLGLRKRLAVWARIWSYRELGL